MLLTVLLVVLGLVLLILVVAAFGPTDFRVTRSTSIQAPPSVLFRHANDLHQFQLWNPWGKIDPNMKSTYAGPTSGVDASYAWSGNAKAGAGSMTITESRPDEFVGMRLDFLKPFKSTSNADFTFQPDGEKTVVTWSMYGKKIFMAKVMSLFIDMDKMIGPDFDRGLANLRQLTEKSPSN